MQVLNTRGGTLREVTAMVKKEEVARMEHEHCVCVCVRGLGNSRQMDMIACEACGHWFHPRCQGMSMTLYYHTVLGLDNTEPFVCGKCKQLGVSPARTSNTSNADQAATLLKQGKKYDAAEGIGLVWAKSVGLGTWPSRLMKDNTQMRMTSSGQPQWWAMVRPLGPDHHSLIHVKVEELKPLEDDFLEHETNGRTFLRSKKSNLGQQAAFEQAVQEARALLGKSEAVLLPMDSKEPNRANELTTLVTIAPSVAAGIDGGGGGGGGGGGSGSPAACSELPPATLHTDQEEKTPTAEELDRMELEVWLGASDDEARPEEETTKSMGQETPAMVPDDEREGSAADDQMPRSSDARTGDSGTEVAAADTKDAGGDIRMEKQLDTKVCTAFKAWNHALASSYGGGSCSDDDVKNSRGHSSKSEADAAEEEEEQKEEQTVALTAPDDGETTAAEYVEAAAAAAEAAQAADAAPELAAPAVGEKVADATAESAAPIVVERVDAACSKECVPMNSTPSPQSEDTRLGCSKCRHASLGCKSCRMKVLNTPQLPLPNVKAATYTGDNESAKEEATVAEVGATAMEETALEEKRVVEEQSAAIEDAGTCAALAARDAFRDALSESIMMEEVGNAKTHWTNADERLLDAVNRLQKELEAVPSLSQLPAPTEMEVEAAAPLSVQLQWRPIQQRLADSGGEATATTMSERKRRIGDAEAMGDGNGRRKAKNSANQMAMQGKPNRSTGLESSTTLGTKSLVSLAQGRISVPTTRPRTKRGHPEKARAVGTLSTPADEQPLSTARPSTTTHIPHTVCPAVMPQSSAMATCPSSSAQTASNQQQLAERLQQRVPIAEITADLRAMQQRVVASAADTGTVPGCSNSHMVPLACPAIASQPEYAGVPSTQAPSTMKPPNAAQPPWSSEMVSNPNTIPLHQLLKRAAELLVAEAKKKQQLMLVQPSVETTAVTTSVEHTAANAPGASPRPVAGKRVRVRGSGKSREMREAERMNQRREALEGPWPTPLQPAEALPYAYASQGRRATAARGGLTAARGHDVRLNRMEPALESLVRGSKVTEAKWAAVGAAVTPASLVRTRGTEFLRTFASQGAIKVRVEDVWDHDMQASRLMNLSWLTQCQLKLRTLRHDYQYVRQALPSTTGDIAVFENVVGEESLNLDYPFGALLEDIYVEFAAAASSCRLMGPSQREAFFHQQIHMGFPSQFLYLQGVALDALVHHHRPDRATARQRAQPAEAHAWEPQALVDAPGSVLVTALDACERLCAPKILATLARGSMVRSGMAAAVVAGESAAADGAKVSDVMGSPEALAVAVTPATPAKRATPRKRKPPAAPPAPPLTQAAAAAEAELSAAGGTMVRAERVLLTNRKARAAEGMTLNLQRTANGRIKLGRTSKGKFTSVVQTSQLQRTMVEEGDDEEEERDGALKAVSANTKKRIKNHALCEIERQRAILTQGAKQASGSGLANEGSSSRGNPNGAAAGPADLGTPKRKARAHGEKESSQAAAEEKETPVMPTPAGGEVDGEHKRTMPRLWGAGIVSPWLYYMGLHSTFAMHFEDYAFGSANVILAEPGSQAWAVWYHVPRHGLALLHQFLRQHLGKAYQLDCLEKRRMWVDPNVVAAWRSPDGRSVPVFRTVQCPGDYVLTDYGAVHWGINLGVGWKAAVNFAFPCWLQAAKEVDEQIRSIEAETGLQRHYRCVPDFTKKEVAEHQWSWLDAHAGGGPAEATACKSKDGHS